MHGLEALAPLLLTAGLLVATFEGLGPSSRHARALASALCIAITLRYLYWRLLFTAPLHQNLLQTLYARLFVGVETCTLVSAILVYFFMSRTVSRSPEADLHRHSPLHAAPTDVFVASFNECHDILERTLVGALALQHPDLRVWLLDDGARPWARELAASLGCLYLARSSGKHAKAGNINHGLQQALLIGRKPQFFLLLDADFIPHQTLLARVLGLFHNPSVGIVQTPQHFFNPDPVQCNLLCSTVWPDEQRFFYNCLLPSKDAWGAAFCCGTSAVFRVEAFLQAGGMAPETVTEDMLTTFKFQQFGFRTIFLNERLSLGLAPESLVEFIAQRARWCLGAMQQIFTRWSFCGSSPMPLISRLAFLDRVLYWVSGAAYKLLLLSAPILFWFTGTAVLHASWSAVLLYAGPMVVGNMLFMRYLAGNRVLPIMTDVTQLLTAFVICRTVATALVRPFGRPFQVTAKGLSSSGKTIQWRILWKFAVLCALTLAGVLTSVARFSPAHGYQGYTATVLCSLLNIAVLALAAAACIELPHRRRDERFQTSEPAFLRLPPRPGAGPGAGPVEIPCRLRDISLGGAALALTLPDPPAWSGNAVLVLSATSETPQLDLQFTIIYQRNATLTVVFSPDSATRHALIRRLFTGLYHQEIAFVESRKVVFSLVKALFA